MNSITEHNLAEYIDRNLSAHSFGRLDRVSEAALTRDFGVIAAWKRRSWFRGNRAVVLVPLPGSVNHPGKFAQEIKLPLGKSIGYFPFLNELGLQLVVTGHSILDSTAGLDKYVDKLSNQRVVLQSLYVVDLSAMDSISVRTWGQYLTGLAQDAIEKSIESFLRETRAA